MRNKSRWFIIIPVFVLLFAFLVIMWTNYIDNSIVYIDSINIILGILLMIIGFYISIISFIVADDSEKNTFGELLKQIGYIIILGVIGLLVYIRGFGFVTLNNRISSLELLNVIVYSNYGIAILSIVGIFKLFRKSNRYYISTFSKIMRFILAISSLYCLYFFVSTYDVIILVISITLTIIYFFVNLSFPKDD